MTTIKQKKAMRLTRRVFIGARRDLQNFKIKYYVLGVYTPKIFLQNSLASGSHKARAVCQANMSASGFSTSRYCARKFAYSGGLKCVYLRRVKREQIAYYRSSCLCQQQKFSAITLHAHTLHPSLQQILSLQALVCAIHPTCCCNC